MWGLGICATGFFITIGWLIKINTLTHQRVTYEWVEKHMDKLIADELKSIHIKLNEISECLLGSMKEAGLFTLVKDNKRRIAELEKHINCPAGQHGENHSKSKG